MVRSVSTAVVCFCAVSALVLPAPAAAQTTKLPIARAHLTSAVPVSGTTSAGGAFKGTLDLARFAIRDGQLVALGTLSGTLTDSAGVVVGTVRNAAAELVLAGRKATCSILHLELGPLDLDLLGLVVHLNKVVLDITAVPGPGNLLGNLLCAIAGLLDSQAALDIVADALNSLLRIVN